MAKNPKIHIRSKNASSESCSALNFLQKSQWAHVSISSKGGAGRLQKLPLLKYFNVL